MLSGSPLSFNQQAAEGTTTFNMSYLPYLVALDRVMSRIFRTFDQGTAAQENWLAKAPTHASRHAS